MNNKEQLQQELKAKIKPGIKPSDLKKKRGEISGSIPTPPPLPSQKKFNNQDQEKVKENPTPEKKPAKNPEERSATKPQYYLFSCDICETPKKSRLHRGRVNGLGIDPNKVLKICDT